MNPLAYALMAKMDYNQQQRVRLKADFLRLILGCPVDPARRSLLIEFVETYLPLAKDEQAEFREIVHADSEYVEVKQMITTYEMTGKKEGKKETLLLLLQERFGEISEPVRNRVLQIDSPKKLDSLVLAVHKVGSLDELPW